MNKEGGQMSKLIQCPMCERMISPNAYSCPQCGEPMKEPIKEPIKEQTSEQIVVAIFPIAESDLGLYEVILSDAGTMTIEVIKVVQEITNSSFGEAKNLVDFAPSIIFSEVTIEVAQSHLTELEVSGAHCQIVPSEFVDVSMIDAGKNFYEINMAIRDYFKILSNEARRITENCPNKLSSNIEIVKAIELKQLLEKVGAEVHLLYVNTDERIPDDLILEKELLIRKK